MDPPRAQLDAVIVGGGIAGAWLLRLLHQRGYRVLLLEAQGWGSQQTLASQGMIHGGLKYALSGRLTGESEAIAAMPARWRACLAGQDDVDLSAVRLLSDSYYMFARASTLGRLTSFFAAKALRGRIDPLASQDWPPAFAGFDGVVYRLNDFVLDTRSLLDTLTDGLLDRTHTARLQGQHVRAVETGYEIDLPHMQLHTRHLISCAGSGSEQLLNELGIDDIRVQSRPLMQVSVRPTHPVQLFGHCLTGMTSSEPRLTITSHTDEQGLLWYLGGKLATSGLQRSVEEQIRFAAAELQACIPWLDWQGAQYDVHYIDRAEPYQAHGHKPDEAYAAQRGAFIQCFPTKLTLTPDLGDRVLAMLPPPAAAGTDLTSSPTPVIAGNAPWHRHTG